MAKYNIPNLYIANRDRSVNNGGGGEAQPAFVYSEDEVEVGSWINGKKLYRKTVTGTATNNATIAIPEGITIVTYDGAFTDETNHNMIPLNYYYNSGDYYLLYADYTNNVIKFVFGGAKTLAATINLYYVKDA